MQTYIKGKKEYRNAIKPFGLFLLIVLSVPLFSQSFPDSSDLYYAGIPGNSEIRHSPVIQKIEGRNSVLGEALTLPYLFYKYFVSSQDLQSCSFYPSCANYGRTALAKKGFLGIFLTLDRITRCHGLDNQSYFAYKGGIWLNPVGQ